MSERGDLQNLPRLLGTYPSASTGAGEVRKGGKLMILIGGLHGNEPAGVRAIRRFFKEVAERGLSIDGRVVGITGNTCALAGGERFIDSDLNRLWTDETVQLDARTTSMAAGVEEPSAIEEAEQQDILRELKRALASEPERALLLDLHSTSAEGSPFAIMADTLQNRPIASALGIPILLGLEERVHGTLLAWFSEMGHAALCIEGGQNELESTVEHHLAVIWITLVSAGFLDEVDVPDLAAYQERLRETAWGLPEFCEIQYRFEVPAEGEFAMEPGFTNFHMVAAGAELARVKIHGKSKIIRSPQDGQLIMPRYQGQGTDGFFIGREISLWSLRLSAVIRRLRLGILLRLLQGVRRNPERLRGLIVDRRVAGWRTVEILHLFGYRRCAREGHELYFLRRPDRFS